MNAFDSAAAEARSFDPLCKLVHTQPLLLCLRWKGGVSMDFVRFGLKLLIVALGGSLFALGGILLSVLSALHNVRAHAAPPPAFDYALCEELMQRRNLREFNASTVSLYSEPMSEDGEPRPTTPSSSDATLVHNAPDAAREPVDSAKPQKDEGAPDTQQSSPSSKRRLSLSKRVVVVIEDCKKHRTHNPSPVSSSSSSPTLSNTEAGPSRLPELSEEHPAPANTNRPFIVRTVTAPPSDTAPPALQSKTRKSWLPRKQRSLPLQRRPAPIPAARTDPYQAPYFFPTPGSPHAVDYVRQVRLSRAAVPPSTGIEQHCQRAGVEGPGVARATSLVASHTPSLLARQQDDTAASGPQPPTSPSPSVSAQKPGRRLSWHLYAAARSPRPSSVGPAPERPLPEGDHPHAAKSLLRNSRRWVMRALVPLAIRMADGCS
ncbi:hypothetical protein WOLCODRAFT_22769 [Wolfiporia cocos MD-104 SS10]|uniref:Uncharacterized protein n=1 Tax=Wolfiporia cocos (strain MD-104) TaxID=742152 RepID=A0A2H3J6Y8_WOLCO|nr:hypothetical protein WOLCODRAFT_22769 [Wolfiporia cocos MD-104 SS10]